MAKSLWDLIRERQERVRAAQGPQAMSVSEGNRSLQAQIHQDFLARQQGSQGVAGQGGMGAGGAMPQGYVDMKNLLFRQSMGPLAADYGRRGIMSSSLYGAASATVGVQSALGAYQMWLNQRQVDLQQRQLEHNILMDQEQARRLRDELRQRWDIHMSGLNQTGAWQFIDRNIGLQSAPPPTDNFGYQNPYGQYGPGAGESWGQQAPEYQWGGYGYGGRTGGLQPSGGPEEQRQWWERYYREQKEARQRAGGAAWS